MIDFLRVQSRAFMFTASAVPAAVGAALGALRIIRSDEGPELLRARRSRTRATSATGFKQLGYETVDSDPVTPIIPVLIGDDWQAVLLWRALYDAGVYVNVALHPAVPPGGALLRTSVMATHEREHLDRALAMFEKVKPPA